ncbi:MAG: ribosome biogenesis GTPase Der [candidate division Zixibacteria bacterium]|nr:ribosome biogenesis GTPase Der [candidate division Zixibacteria bacterium]
MTLPVVAIVGRPNVGKSSLFNRFIRQRLAVVDSISGVTRDRNFSVCDWSGRNFYMMDTGGIVLGTNDAMERLILEQAQLAMEEADVILFLVDCKTGITESDTQITRQLIRTNKPVILAVNKTDNDAMEIDATEFYGLGFEKYIGVSAANGRGVGDLLDEIIACLPKEEDENADDDTIKVAVVGRPNVGKSSFVNNLLGEDRHIVSEVPGTTRDSIDSIITVGDKTYTFIDTAGLRKRTKVKESIEYYTTLRSFRAIHRCDVALILLDASEGLNFQELKIIDEVAEAGRGMILAVNKWDIFEKDHKSAMIYTRQLQEAMPTYSYIPSTFISALTGQRVKKTLNLIDAVYDEFNKRLDTAELNKFLEEVVAKQPPAAAKGRWIKLYYITQPEVAPPTFVIFSNYPKLIQESYHRYLSNRLREQFGYIGVPFRLKFKPRGKQK